MGTSSWSTRRRNKRRVMMALKHADRAFALMKLMEDQYLTIGEPLALKYVDAKAACFEAVRKLEEFFDEI